MAKARIHGIENTPRSEMNGLLMLTRLLTALLPGMVDKPGQVTFIGDSQCTIASCEAERSVLTQWYGNRGREVREHFREW